MFRFLLRAMALLLLASAFAAVIVDGTRTIAAGALTVTSAGQAIAVLAPAKLSGMEAAARGALAPILAAVLLVPTWLLAGVCGTVLLALTRQRRPLVGHSSR